MKTITVEEMIEMLQQFPDDFKVYLSTDSEGNSFGTVDTAYSFQYSMDDKVVMIFPLSEGLQHEDICPIENAEIEASL